MAYTTSRTTTPMTMARPWKRVQQHVPQAEVGDRETAPYHRCECARSWSWHGYEKLEVGVLLGSSDGLGDINRCIVAGS